MSTDAEAASASPRSAAEVTEGQAATKAHRREGPRGFATRANYFTVDDIVWVRPPGHPFWPAEVIAVLDEAATSFRCRLFSPPAGFSEVIAHGSTLFFFDKLFTEEDVMQIIEARLQRNKHEVGAYESAFVAAVREANEIVRVVLDPSTLFANPRHVVTCKPIGVLHCYHRTHTSAPRQPHTGEVTAPALGVIKLAKGFENAVRDLKGFERVWITFHFSYATTFSDVEDARGFSYMVVPPRDSVARGVLATRSPHRPNPIGLSCVRLVDVRGLEVHIADHDLLHGTPVLDIKPYLPFCDAHPHAKAGWVDKLNASGQAKGDHRADSAPDVALVRTYPAGRRPRAVDAFTGLPVTTSPVDAAAASSTDATRSLGTPAAEN
jgi:tRNA-Thr(GGU) m(6)t(6)A37 methyltransferase TsaA